MASAGRRDDERAVWWEGTGCDLTDHRNCGPNRRLLTASHGMPLASTVDGDNRHDRPLGQRTLTARPMVRPQPTDTQPQHRCIDAGDDAATIRTVVAAWGDIAHMRTWGKTPLPGSSSLCIAPDDGWWHERPPSAIAAVGG